MLLEFCKYQGTGNDFIVIDDRSELCSGLKGQQVSGLCNRRFGIGADGLVFIRRYPEVDFRMIYYNADGKEGSMCGNAGRCAVSFARKLGIIKNKAVMETYDGMHEAQILQDGTISLGMNPVNSIGAGEEGYLLDTGSPHLVLFKPGIDLVNVVEEGRRIRYSAPFMPDGINVNYVEPSDNELYVRTYERGVENETLSCGTGIVASAICSAFRTGTDKNSLRVRSRGGNLTVRFTRKGDTHFDDIRLEGPAEFVFEGTIDI
jgi:diaminopimelate epimerase